MKKYFLLFGLNILFLVQTVEGQTKDIFNSKVALNIYTEYNVFYLNKDKDESKEKYPSIFDASFDLRFAISPKIGIAFNGMTNLNKYTTYLESSESSHFELINFERYEANYYSYGGRVHLSLSNIPTNYGASIFLGFEQMKISLDNLKENGSDISRNYNIINLGLDNRKFFNDSFPLYLYYGLEFNIHLNDYDTSDEYDEGFFEEVLFSRTVYNGTVGLGYLF